MEWNTYKNFFFSKTEMTKSNRVCGPVKSSKNPNAFEKSELIIKAIQQLKLTETKARAMTKRALCEALGLGFVDKSTTSKKAQFKILKKVSKEIPTVVQKICTKRRSIPRYTKAELETLAKERNLETKGKTYEELCKLLKLPVDNSILLPQTPPGKKHSVDCIDRSKKSLKDYQKGVVQYLKRHRGLIVFHKVGSGKTLTAITVSQCYLDANPTHKVIVITPAGLLNNFKDEMKTSYGELNHLDRYHFYSFQGFMNACKKKPVDCSNALLIVDEAHNLRTAPSDGKKPKGKMARHVLACSEKANKVLLMTGTPLYNDVKDLRMLYDMIRPHGTRPVAGTTIATERVLRDLRCKISYYDPGKSDKFPKKIEKVVSIPMTDIYRKKYERLIQDIFSKESGYAYSIFGEKNLEAFYNAVRRAVNNLDNTQANAKTTWIVDYIKKTPPDEKIVLFSNFLDAGMKLITDRLPKSIPYAIIRGDIPMKRRKEIVQAYNEDKIKVLFISKAGGEGLDLKGTRHIIIMDPSWNQASVDQVIGRGIRYESHEHLPVNKRNVHVFHLDHLTPEDASPAVLEEVKKYLNQIKTNPEIDLKSIDKIPLDPYLNSIDFYLRILTKRKEIVLQHFAKKMEALSIEKTEC